MTTDERKAKALREADALEAMAATCAIPAQAETIRRMARSARERYA
jgi:hypothetical protein